MIMVKGDEKSRIFRDRMEALKQFSEVNALPEQLTSAMREHIELQFLRDQVSDDQVLADYPTTLRRKALRHLYAHTLVECPLFRGARGRFLDQLLAGCRSELFMPHVSLMSEGDIASELLIIVDGAARGVPAGVAKPDLAKLRRTSNTSTVMDMGSTLANATANRRRSLVTYGTQLSGALSLHGRTSTNLGSEYGGPAGFGSMKEGTMLKQSSGGLRSRRSSILDTDAVSIPDSVASTWMTAADPADGGHMYGPSDCIGTVPFFTDTSSTENVYTTEVTRVLIVSKAVFDNLNSHYPQQVSS